MKKSLLTFAAITAASLSQAASLTWMVTNVKSPADKTVAGEGYTVMLFMISQTSSADNFENFGKANTTLAKVTELADAGKFDDLANLAAVSKETTSAGAVTGATGYNGNNFGSGDSLSAFAIVIDKDKKKYFTTNTASASWTSGTGSKQLSFGSQANASYSSFGPVPEPATGALALAGIALLFRRRK